MSRPVGGILSDALPGEGQRTGVAIHLSGLPGERPFSGTRRAACLPRLALLRVGFTEPAGSPSPLVRSCRTFSPLPVRAGDPQPAIGGFLSVALSCESPRLASPAPCSSESRPSSTRSRLAPARAAATRPTHRRLQFVTRSGGIAPGPGRVRCREVGRRPDPSPKKSPRRDLGLCTEAVATCCLVRIWTPPHTVLADPGRYIQNLCGIY